MIYRRRQTYWYKFSWSIKQHDNTSKSFLIRRSARTKIATEAEEVEHEHRRALGAAKQIGVYGKGPVLSSNINQS